MKILKTFKHNKKSAIITISGEVLSCTFFKDDIRLGEIEYPNNSFTYVEDAAENWINGVMTTDTINNYKKTVDTAI